MTPRSSSALVAVTVDSTAIPWLLLGQGFDSPYRARARYFFYSPSTPTPTNRCK